MERDFHFFGTFAAASWAGFSEEHAFIIASAAQFVDDCTEKVTHKSPPLQGEIRQVYVHTGAGYTFTPITTGVGDMKPWQGAATADEIRQVWMPFHFLPGNVASQDDPVVVRESADGEALDILCRPRSAAARELVNFAVDRFAELVDVDELLALMLVGICMHVFADTYAHQDFAGTASSDLNATRQGLWRNTGTFTNKGLWRGRRWEPDDRSRRAVAWPWVVPKTAINTLTAYSALPEATTRVGHGQMGRLPDISAIAFDYDPCWSDGGTEINRNNPEAFLACFMDMIRALRAVSGGEPFAWPESEGALDEAYEEEWVFYERVAQVICPDRHGECDRALYDSGLNMAASRWFNVAEERWEALISETFQPVLGINSSMYETIRDAWVGQAREAGAGELSVNRFKSLSFIKWNCAAKAVFAHLFRGLQKPGRRMKMLTLKEASACMPPQFHLLDEIAEFWIPKGGLPGGYYFSEQVERLKVRNRALQRVNTPFEIETLFFG